MFLMGHFSNCAWLVGALPRCKMVKKMVGHFSNWKYNINFHRLNQGYLDADKGELRYD